MVTWYGHIDTKGNIDPAWMNRVEEVVNYILDNGMYCGNTALTAVNDLNQLFVSTVRATGGNNAKRYLVVNTYAASTVQAIIDGFILPKDTLDNYLIVQVRAYVTIEGVRYYSSYSIIKSDI